MTRLTELQQKFQICQNQLIALNKDYDGKARGKAYDTRYLQLVRKMEDIQKLVLSYGTSGNIVKVSGSILRPNKRNPGVRVHKNFTLYFSNVDPADIPGLLKIRLKNVTNYKIEIHEPGKVNITK